MTTISTNTNVSSTTHWTGDAFKSSGYALLFTSLLFFLLTLNILGIPVVSFLFQSISAAVSIVASKVFDAKGMVLLGDTYGNKIFVVNGNNDDYCNVDDDDYNDHAGLTTTINTTNSTSINDPSKLPLTVVLPLTSIPTLIWLVVKYVSLRLHLGRN